MSTFEIKQKNKIKRHPERGYYDKSTIYKIIDEALFCDIGFIHEERPFVIPTMHARHNDHLIFHGPPNSRLLQHIREGNEISASMTIVDGLVLAKTAFSQSINYRSVVLFGKGILIEDEDEKMKALEYFIERFMPGQWNYVRKPNSTELKATSVVSVLIEEASAKIRNAPPKNSGEDKDLPIWAGVIPIKQIPQTPIRADYTDNSIALPDHIMKYTSMKQ